MQVKVYAKLNLTLSVGAKRSEFHPIDSVATSVDIYDVVDVTARADNQVRVSGVDGVQQERNTAYRAACAFVEAFSTTGVDVTVHKGIPFGGGLGGSSADAAAVLYCMCKLHGVDVDCDEVRAICSKLGSDVTFMMHGGLGRLRGKGDEVVFSQLKQPICFALTTFEQEMSTREVYEAFDGSVRRGDTRQQTFEDANNAQLLNLLEQGATERAISYLRNDLQQAATAVSDYAAQYLRFAEKNGLSAVMTGSGSAYYVAFATRDDAQKVVNLLNSNGFTTTLCKTVPHGIQGVGYLS